MALTRSLPYSLCSAGLLPIPGEVLHNTSSYGHSGFKLRVCRVSFVPGFHDSSQEPHEVVIILALNFLNAVTEAQREEMLDLIPLQVSSRAGGI